MNIPFYEDLETGWIITKDHPCHLSFGTVVRKNSHYIIDIVPNSEKKAEKHSYSFYQMFLLMKNQIIDKFFLIK